ncbi:MAG: hypothetical protein ABFS39_00960 [Pseudomonadota bacterium]
MPRNAGSRERTAFSLKWAGVVARQQLRLGDQPIDVLVIDPGTIKQPVHTEALRTGVEL